MVNKKIRIVTTSWDDGHKLDLKLAKLLKKYNIKATFYVSPENHQWDKKDLLSNNDIKQLSEDFEIGAHTMTHPVLTKINKYQVETEVVESKKYLQKLLDKEIKMFCYPRGTYNCKVKSIVKKAGFLGARTAKTFKTSAPKDFFEFGTTMHPVRRKINYSIRLALVNNQRFIPFLFTKDWVKITKKTFDMVNKHGGVWHFWFHSWEIDKKVLWKQVEEVLKYVSKRPGFHYFTNGETLEHFRKSYGQKNL